jgi:arsenate reductase (thioredoxin)
MDLAGDRRDRSHRAARRIMMPHKIYALLLLTCVAAAQKAGPQPAVTQSTVVFVCDHGAAKSVVAAAHFNRLAAEQGLPYRAVARGIKPDEKVPAAIAKSAMADGTDVSGWVPTQISVADTQKAVRVITLSIDAPLSVPVTGDKLLNWKNLPAIGENPDAARAAIYQRVAELIRALTPKSK